MNAPDPDETHYNQACKPTRNTSCPQRGTAYIGRCPPFINTFALPFYADTGAGSQKQWTSLVASDAVVLCPSAGGFRQTAETVHHLKPVGGEKPDQDAYTMAFTLAGNKTGCFVIKDEKPCVEVPEAAEEAVGLDWNDVNSIDWSRGTLCWVEKVF